MPALAGPHFAASFNIEMDASSTGAGADLIQEHSGTDHPVCCFFRKFLQVEKNYSMSEEKVNILSLYKFLFAAYCDHNT